MDENRNRQKNLVARFVSTSGMKSTRQNLERVAPYLYRHQKNGTYYGIKRLGGRVEMHSLGTAIREVANGELQNWLAELKARAPGNPDLTLAMLLAKFAAARSGKSASTVTSETGMAAEFKASFPRPMETPVASVVATDLASWLAAIRPGKRGRTFNRWRLFVRQLFELAVADGVISKSPFVDRLLKPAKPEKVMRRIPSEAEFLAIVAEIRKPSWKHVKGRRGGQRPRFQHEAADFVEFLGRAGVGQAEAASLRWEDIDDRVMSWTRAKTGGALRVLITPDLRPLLERRRKDAGGTKASGLVFKIKNAKHSLQTALARLGLPSYTQRNLRSFKIVKMLEAGVDVKFIADQQGHKDGGKLILDTYSDVVRRSQAQWEDAQLARMETAKKSGQRTSLRPRRG